MTGRRLLDAAAIFTAVRKVAVKHVALRTRQLEFYSKTSTLVRTIQSQSDRVNLTVKAAAALAQRFNGPEHQYSTQPSQTDPPRNETNASGRDGFAESKKGAQPKQGLARDHFYKKSNENTTVEPQPEGDLEVKQEKAQSAPLPDGSVPSVWAPPAASDQNKDTFPEVPKTAVSGSILEEKIQKPEETIQPAPSGNTNIPEFSISTDPQSTDKAKELQRQAEKQIPSQAAEPPPASALEPDGEANTDNETFRINIAQEQQAFYTPISSTSQVLSNLPRAKIPRNTRDTQESEEDVPSGQIDQDVFYSSRPNDKQQAVPEAQAVPKQEQLSEEAYSEIFHSPRVAEMLRGQPRKDNPSKGLELSGANDTPVKHTKAPRDQDQVSSGMRTPAPDGVDSATSTNIDEDNVHDLAADMAKDADRVSSDTSEVSQKKNNVNAF